jgi:hypothetical protein
MHAGFHSAYTNTPREKIHESISAMDQFSETTEKEGVDDMEWQGARKPQDRDSALVKTEKDLYNSFHV